ncbi:hypothetical protein ES704_03785 [subsurface metagenome]|jgi:predicted site-specific integrase-resolvase
MELKEEIKAKRNIRGVKFFCSEDVAKILGLSILSARLYLKDGKIPGAVKIGRRWFVSGKNLDKWLQQGYLFTQAQAQVIETKVIEDIKTTLEKMRQKQKELEESSAPKEAVEKLKRRLTGIENYWEDYLKEKIKDS